MLSSTARLRFCIVLMRSGLPRAEPVEFVGLRVEVLGVGLVGDQNNRHLDGAQAAGDFLIERQHALAGIDDEQDHVGRVDGEVDLVFDVLA